MELSTYYKIEGGILELSKQSKADKINSIKLTSKSKQNAQDKARGMTETFDRVLKQHNAVNRIEAKQDKKRNFFNKHKNK